jgi:AraC-like DNA-binding protein
MDSGSDLISAIRPGVEIVSRAPASGAGRQVERVTQPARGVPTICWGPDTIGRRGLFEAWHEAARPLFDTAPGHQERSFSGGGTVARLGELIVTEVDFTGQRFRRTRRHTAETGGFSLQLYTRGGVVGTTEDVPYRLAPDRIALFDFSREHHAIATQPSEVLGASIPRDQLDISAAVDPPAVMWSRISPAGRLLIGALRLLRGEIDRLPAAQAAEAAAGFIGLLNGLLGSRREVHDPRLVRQLCLATMGRYIERNLGRPELDAAMLGRAFASSRTRLYDLFRERGGVERYLRQRRLSRCFRDLAAAAPGTTRIVKVAERWGFHDQSHFHRLFKQQFGLRPSDVLASQAGGPADDARHGADLRQGFATAHAWFRSL